MGLFYHPDAVTGSILTLSREESSHIARVLRMQPGHCLRVTNGRGSLYLAEILECRPSAVKARLGEEACFKPRNFSIHIALAPTKNIKRTEWFVEKAVETGIEQISFFQSRHSVRASINLERIYKVAVAAMKQSERYHLPLINDMQKLEALTANATEEYRWIAHCRQEQKRMPMACPTHTSNLVLIGPEGGFHEQEIQQALENNFSPVELNPFRLRTETAALTACQWLNIVNTYTL